MKNRVFRINQPGEYTYKLPFDKNGETGSLQGVIEARTKGDYQVRVEANHLAVGTTGRVEVRGVVENGARVNLTGLVEVAENAKGTDSFLALKLLMLDDKSFALAEPELTIMNNEVKASHSASVGRIDKEQMFYLSTRGIGEKAAKELIVEGFLGKTDGKIINNLE